MPITIKDVAKKAGVSISTVSKSLNDNYSISSATKEKINKVIKELNYYPNIMAKSFAQQNPYNIGVVMDLNRYDAFTKPHLYEILAGIEDVVQQNGYILTLTNIHSKANKKQIIEKIVMQRVVNALILHVNTINKSICKWLDSLNFPYVVIGQSMSTQCWVDINNELAGEMATTHLIEEGYKKIAFIGGTETDEISQNRLAGYKKSISAHNLEIIETYIKACQPNIETSEILMKELLDLPVAPDSIVCVNNFVAFGAIKAIKSRGLSIPKDVALITFDNYPLALYSEPPLSVIDIDVFELGYHVATLLMNKIKNPSLKVQYNMLSPTLVIRQSSKK